MNTQTNKENRVSPNSMKFVRLLSVLVAALFAAGSVSAQSLVVRNARIFDGTSDQLSTQQDVLIVDGVIDSIGSGLSNPGGVREIDASGLTLMPGLIDAHTHVMLQLPVQQALTSDDYYYATSDRTYFDAMTGKPKSKDLEIFNYNDKFKKIYYFMPLGSGIQNLSLDKPLLKNELSFNKLKDLKNSIGKNLNFKLCVCSHRFKGYNIQIGSGILSIISLLHLSKKVNVYGWDGFLSYNFPNSFYRQSYKLWSPFSDFHPISRFSAIVFNWIYAHRLINYFKSDRLFVHGQLNHITKLKWVEKYLYKMIYKKSKI